MEENVTLGEKLARIKETTVVEVPDYSFLINLVKEEISESMEKWVKESRVRIVVYPLESFAKKGAGLQLNINYKSYKNDEIIILKQSLEAEGLNVEIGALLSEGPCLILNL